MLIFDKGAIFSIVFPVILYKLYVGGIVCIHTHDSSDQYFMIGWVTYKKNENNNLCKWLIRLIFFGFTNFNSLIYFVFIFAEAYCKATYIGHIAVTPSRQTLHGFLSLSNYFNKMNEEKPIYEAAYRLEGYFSKQSYQLVFLTLFLFWSSLGPLLYFSCTSLERLLNVCWSNLPRTSLKPLSNLSRTSLEPLSNFFRTWLL